MGDVIRARSSRPGPVPLLLGLLAVVATVVAGLTVGAAGISPTGVLRAVLDGLPFVELDHGLTATEHRILFEIRMPRVILGGLVGASLALAGAAYQGVFRNPLADPYLLGVAAGAGLGATAAFTLGVDRWLVAPFAFVGAILAVAVTYLLGRSVGGRTTTSLILAGVAVGAFATALQTFMLQRRHDVLREVYSWILGRLTTVGWAEVRNLLPYVIVAGVVLWAVRRPLDVLSVGEDEAAALGVNVGRLRGMAVVAATLITAAAVSVSGLIGFVGIIVPHIVRVAFGWSYRVILPLSILFGAAFLMAADILTRTVVAPGELPVGVITAFLGAPFFILVLRTMGRSE